MSSTWLGNQAREYTEIINSKDSKTIEDPASVSCSTIPCGISDLRYDIINPEGITSETKELERIIGC